MPVQPCATEPPPEPVLTSKDRAQLRLDAYIHARNPQSGGHGVAQPLVYEPIICTSPVPSMTSPTTQASMPRPRRKASARSVSAFDTTAIMPTPMLKVDS